MGKRPLDSYGTEDSGAQSGLIFQGKINEEHKLPVYCVSFYDPQDEEGDARLPCEPRAQHFASVGANRAMIYQVGADGVLSLAQSYVDEDGQETLYACAWSTCTMTGSPLLSIAGLRGIIKVIDCRSAEVVTTLVGHGNSVNDLRAHPVASALLLSASKDESLRLWNIHTSTCIAIFAGLRGHRDEVLSADIHLLGNCFVSAGMDNTVKIWALETPRIQTSIEKSYALDALYPLGDVTVNEQFPVFSTNRVHKDYVDCVRWVGNLILSKSTNNRIVMWKPDVSRLHPPERMSARETSSATALPARHGKDTYVEDGGVGGSSGRSGDGAQLHPAANGVPPSTATNRSRAHASRHHDDSDDRSCFALACNGSPENGTCRSGQRSPTNRIGEGTRKEENGTSSVLCGEETDRRVHKRSTASERQFDSTKVEVRAVLDTMLKCAEQGKSRIPASGIEGRPGRVVLLHEFEFKDANIWFLRFDVDPTLQLLAVGNKYGKLWIWRIDSFVPIASGLGHPKCTQAVRQVSFSPDHRCIVCCCEDGSIWKYGTDSSLLSDLHKRPTAEST